jgi:hypothetical protein
MGLHSLLQRYIYFYFTLLSDERIGPSFTTAAGHCQRSHSWVRVPRDSWSYFTASDSRLPYPEWPGPRIYVPQWQGGQVKPPGTEFPFRCLIRLAGLRWKYSILFCTTCIVSRRTNRKHIRCLAMDIYELHRKHLFFYCCVYSSLHTNGSYPMLPAYFGHGLSLDIMLFRAFLCGNVFRDPLPSNGYMRHNIIFAPLSWHQDCLPCQS